MWGWRVWQLQQLGVRARNKLAGWETTLWVGSGLPGPARWPGKVVAELRRCRCVRKSCCGVVWVVGCRGDSTGGEDMTEREEHVSSA